MRMSRWSSAVCVLVGVLWTVSCGAKGSARLSFGDVDDNSTGVVAPLRIAAFNIQVFGLAKMRKPHVVAKIIQILRRYDLILIEEIRDVTNRAIFKLLYKLNRICEFDKFNILLSERLGRTSAKEQYAYLYRASKLTVKALLQWPTEESVFERPPFVVRFRARIHDIRDFAFVGVHVKPEDAAVEVDALTDVYTDISKRWNMTDIILGGDFNAGCKYIRPRHWKEIRLRQQERFDWVIDDDADTTISESRCPFDRFVLAGATMRKFYVFNSSVPFRFDNEFNMTQAEAYEVSDHVPIELQIY